MLELVLLFQVFVAQIPSISSKSLSYITSSGFASNMVFLSITKRDFNIYKYIHKKENKPHFNDEKLVYIYGNRRRFRVCEENTGDEANEVSDRLLEFRKKTSHAYQIDTQKYILELSCYPGAYNVYKEYYLYSITNYGIEIKPLLLISSDGEELNFNGQFLPLWEYKKGIRALPTFDPEHLTLKVKTVRDQNGGYIAEYKFEDNEFKLVLYKLIPKYDRVDAMPNVKVLYP